jgi:hypothetical protein
MFRRRPHRTARACEPAVHVTVCEETEPEHRRDHGRTLDIPGDAGKAQPEESRSDPGNRQRHQQLANIKRRRAQVAAKQGDYRECDGCELVHGQGRTAPAA